MSIFATKILLQKHEELKTTTSILRGSYSFQGMLEFKVEGFMHGVRGSKDACGVPRPHLNILTRK
jgi:hypothetical protein